jgi:hypothetical protein
MVYDAIMGGGIHLERVGILTAEGKVEIVYDKDYIKDKFPDPVGLRGKFSDTQLKKINLTDIIKAEGMNVEKHPLNIKTEKWEGIYIFDTPYNTLRELIENNAFSSNNVIWRFALLEIDDGDPNAFLRKTTGFDEGHYVMYATHASSFSFGSSGRSIKVADNYDKEKGYPWPSNWQTEDIWLEIDRDMILSAIFSLDDKLKKLVMSDSPDLDAPWIVVHNPSKGVTFENQEILPPEESRRHLQS